MALNFSWSTCAILHCKNFPHTKIHLRQNRDKVNIKSFNDTLCINLVKTYKTLTEHYGNTPEVPTSFNIVLRT